MRISLDKLTDRELVIEEEVSARDWDMDGLGVKFTGDLFISCSFLKKERTLSVKTKVVMTRRIVCSRCLEPSEQEVTENLGFSYDLDGLGGYLDMDKDIREAILLNFPLQVLCDKECKGICPRCGVNLNKESCSCGDKRA